MAGAEEGPGEGTEDIGGPVMLDHALGARQTTDVEAVQLNDLARSLHLEMALGWRLRPRRQAGRGIGRPPSEAGGRDC
jgi:hypothetical protein